MGSVLQSILLKLARIKGKPPNYINTELKILYVRTRKGNAAQSGLVRIKATSTEKDG